MGRRRSVRFSLSVPVTFRWAAGEGSEHELQGYGMSCDVCRDGILVECKDKCPPVHAEVQLVMTIAAQEAGLELISRAEITRVYRYNNTQLFAAVGKFEMAKPTSAESLP
jgi:hypothetical protein